MKSFKKYLLKRKECVKLTFLSKLILLFLVGIISFMLVKKLPEHLCHSAPLKSGYLIIDGQMPDYVLQEAISIYSQYDYDKIITTGGNLISGYYLTGELTMAELTNKTLLTLGFDSANVIVISGSNTPTNRTLNSAIDLKNWMEENDEIEKLDIITEGFHAKRSQLLFQKVLGKKTDVGVWAIQPASYDTEKWWKTSKGARTFISETIAYFYSYFISY